MKSIPHSSHSRRGSALLTVLFLITVMAILTASMLRYSASEQRGNERNRLILRAKNMAESVSIYAAEQLTTKLYRLGSAPSGKVFPWTGTSRNRVYMPPDSMINNEYTSAANVEMRTGILSASPYALITDTTSPNNGLQVSTARVPIIAKASAGTTALGTVTAYVEQDMEIALTPLFQFGMFYNMDMELYPSQAFTLTGPVHSNNRILAHPDGSANITITFRDRVTMAEGLYADSSLKAQTRGANGVANAASPGTGDVIFYHTNNTPTSLKNSSSLWRDHKYLTTTETASTLSQFKTFATTTYNGNLRTSVHGVTKLALPGIGTYKETNDPSTIEDDRSNGRQIIEPPDAKVFTAGAWVANTDDSDTKETKLSWRSGLYIIANPSGGRVTSTDGLPRSATLPDGTTAWVLPRSYRAWLNVLNSSTGVHTMYEVILPGQPAYGYNAGNAGSGNKPYMYVNNFPNKYTASAITGIAGNQVLRMIRPNNASVTSNALYYAAASLTDDDGYAPGLVTYPADGASTATALNPGRAYFYDLRRANSNRGVISYSGTTALYDRFHVPYVPRPIVKIDFDMAKFKMMVARTVYAGMTVSGYDIRPPTETGVNYANSIYKASSTPATFGLGLGAGYNVFPSSGAMTAPDPFNVYLAPIDPTVPSIQNDIATDPRAFVVPATRFYDASNPCAWYDGIAVYVHSLDAEVRQQTSGAPVRVDSGVRLWNGRGPVASLTAGGATGMTFVTNDAVYIVGHYNADGTINSTLDVTGYGGTSSRQPDSANEMLCAVMGDAITIVSQPTWSGAATGQDGGWNDALSALPVAASTAGWATGASATAALTGNDDGVANATAIRPGLLPTDSNSGGIGTATSIKLAPDVDSEISTALLVGIIPSNHNPATSTATTTDDLTDGVVVNFSTAASGTPALIGNGVNSGGANNFPRLLDNWSGRNLWIRGSMVALFESRVAMEPFTNSRNYRAPGRYWGLHENFRTANHDVPLEPIVLGNTRVGFRALSAGEYAAMKTALEALTALP